MHRALGIALALPFASVAAPGQTLSIPNGWYAAQIIAAAEQEGATFQRLSTAQQTGAARRTCIVGIETGPARSGEFTIGGNLAGFSAMVAGRPGKVWWAPLHYSHDMPPLVVRGRSLTASTDTVRFTSSRVGWTGQREADRKYFFPSGITIPRPGRWLLIATSGADCGCFILSVR